jgi:NIMA (never in mitosis gene a)-related kinase
MFERKRLLVIIILTQSLYMARPQIKCEDKITLFQGYSCVEEMEEFSQGNYQKFIIKKENRKFILKVVETEDENYKDLVFLKQLKNERMILELIDFKIDQKMLFEILEYPENGSLYNYSKKSDFFKIQKNILKFLLNLIELLNLIHSKGYVKGNLNLDSIYIDENVKAKFGDFESIEQIDTVFQPEDTTPFIDPFLLSNWNNFLKKNPKEDIFNFGLIVYYLIHNDFPFISKNAFSLYKELEFNKTIQIKKGVSIDLVNILDSTIKSNPQDRKSLYELEGMVMQGISNHRSFFIDMKINLKLDSGIYQERIGYFEMFSEMIFVFFLVLFIIPVSVYLITKKIEKDRNEPLDDRNENINEPNVNNNVNIQMY